jgi:hypothetical protein
MLNLFAFMVEADIEKMGDRAAMTELLRLLERQDPFILLKKDAPMFWALIKRFGLVQPNQGRERMDALPAELVCKTIVAFERWRISVLRLQHAEEFMVHFDGSYNDSSPAKPIGVFSKQP